ncbi:MAG: hypothetical protein ACYDCH_06520 [Gaiellaceae bacterium]
MTIVRVLVALAGAAVVLTALLAAVQAFVVPRGIDVPFVRVVFRSVIRGFSVLARLRGARERDARDAIMVYAAPLAVLSLPFVWLVSSLVGYAAVFWAIDHGGFGNAVVISGSSLFTLGFDRPAGVGGAIAAFSEAAVGLALLAVVISYLPSLNTAFARRELVVAMLDARAGKPPDGVTLIERHHVFAGIEHLDLLWPEWERWAVEVGESHSTHPMLAFFRSSDSGHSWVTAFTALLDAANLRLSCIQASGAGNASAWMFFQAASGVISGLGRYFRLPDDMPRTTISRAEFDAVLAHFREVGVPLVDDLDDAWARFCRRRSQYEHVVDGLSAIVDAPPSKWWLGAPR